MSAPVTVHLVDALPYVFRAYFSLPSSLKAPDGTQINAIRGFATFLLQLIEQEQPTHAAVCFDGSLTTSFRNDIYPAYKSSRELPPPELEAQLDACFELAGALGFETWIDDRYEADDAIGALVHKLRPKGHKAVVITSDKDLAQLVDDGVVLWDFAKDVRYGPAEVKEKFGVRPDQIADYLGLAGDSVDDIPGVKGVGAKTAAALLESYANIDALYADLDGVAGLPIRGAKTLGKKLEADREAAFLSRTLATIADDAPVRADLRRLRYKAPDLKALTPLCERLGLGFVLDRIA